MPRTIITFCERSNNRKTDYHISLQLISTYIYIYTHLFSLSLFLSLSLYTHTHTHTHTHRWYRDWWIKGLRVDSIQVTPWGCHVTTGSLPRHLPPCQLQSWELCPCWLLWAHSNLIGRTASSGKGCQRQGGFEDFPNPPNTRQETQFSIPDLSSLQTECSPLGLLPWLLATLESKQGSRVLRWLMCIFISIRHTCSFFPKDY